MFTVFTEQQSPIAAVSVREPCLGPSVSLLLPDGLRQTSDRFLVCRTIRVDNPARIRKPRGCTILKFRYWIDLTSFCVHANDRPTLPKSIGSTDEPLPVR